MTQTLTISQPQFDLLMNHLFPGDGDEHGAALLAGVVETSRGVRFLTREVIIAKEGVDYVPGTTGYRALTTDFIVRVTDRCAQQKLCYFAVHCHGGSDSVDFSPIDIASQRRGYPALLDITNGGPVGALVFAKNAVAGKIWRKSGVSTLDGMRVIGPNLTHLYPNKKKANAYADEQYSRQSLLFGHEGQLALAHAKVGIIGLGGVGSLVSQWLSHLGVGTIVGIDYDKLETSNRSRVVGSRWWDAAEPFSRSQNATLKKLGTYLAKHKVAIAKRVAKAANGKVNYVPVIGDVIDEATARLLLDVDYLFLCADSMRARLVFNSLIHQYMIPGVQIGSKVQVDKKTGDVKDVFVVSRRVLPFSGGGCLSCNGLIPPDLLQEESLSPEQRQRQRYMDDVRVTAPSVITLNALATGQAVNDFLFYFHGLLHNNAQAGYLMHYPRERLWQRTAVDYSKDCIQCGVNAASGFARGDRWSLPCRSKS